MRKAENHMTEDRRWPSRSQYSNSENKNRQWCQYLGDVDVESVEAFARELPYVVDRLGVLNERISIVQVEGTDRLTSDDIRVSAGPACQVFSLGGGKFVVLYLGPKSAQAFCRDVAGNLLMLKVSCPHKSPVDPIVLRLKEVYSQEVVEPHALLSELALATARPTRDLI